ncbi:mRNA interferase [Nocardioides psychrotolerans]|nr:mRNA interferase [Nocardioides psychrotolerans]
MWAWLDPSVGREQAGRRPVVVVSSDGYLDVVTTLAVVVPVSRTDRGWPNHVPLTGVSALPDCFAMSEQSRTLSRDRLGEPFGQVDDLCLAEIKVWLAAFLDI